MTIYIYDEQGWYKSCKALTPQEVCQRQKEREIQLSQASQYTPLPPSVVVTYTYDASGAICQRVGEEPAMGEEPATGD